MLLTINSGSGDVYSWAQVLPISLLLLETEPGLIMINPSLLKAGTWVCPKTTTSAFFFQPVIIQMGQTALHIMAVTMA